MTTLPSPRSPRFLLITTMVLAGAGLALMTVPHQPGTPTPSAAAPTTASQPRSSPLSPSAGPAGTGVPSTAAAARPPTASTSASALPPRGEGVADDRAIQHALEAAWPADLPARDAHQLLADARALLRADATGIGRAKWPGVFPHSGQGLAPAFGTGRFRIQAAIARRDGRADRAVVHLVWAGADRGGTYTDGRITDWHFTRTTSTKGAPAWTPLPPT
ncbi:hypothetical protein [Streptomyces herbicida]|uniref:hypothetical protein n=1 Tax=Streptomyces herbicida TaxID=3065675 RepID=UPI00292EDBCB|nr:hypothetical protein [Streptomyces sp. NEAU-HV9]